MAWRLASAGELDHKGVEGGDFWAVAAEQRLAPLLFAAARSGAGIEALVRWVYGQAPRELDEALAQIAGEASDEAQLRTRTPPTTRYGRLRRRRTERAARSRPPPRRCCARTGSRASRGRRRAREITADRLLDDAATLYLIGDAKASKLLRPLFLALLSRSSTARTSARRSAGGQLERPLLLCLDEAGNVAPLPNLAEIASTAPSHNIQLLSIFHDLAQARSRYSRQAETVINSHRARMLLPGVADLDTLRYFAGLVGEEEAAK